ncbi:MAG: glutathione-disulfide reductase [Alphaproteobacteria bacterium]|nr:glutathione-disulfide reductase [Alphaproteobacteria bacterium]
MSSFDVDLFVIGGGSGGVRAARIAASYGAKVMLAEEYRMGGTCVIRGCVPKKLYVQASRFADDLEDARGFGWSIEDTHFDFANLKAAKDKEIARLEGLYRQTLEKNGVEIVAQRATLKAPHEVALVDGRVIRSRYVLIATGGAPSFPDATPGIALAEDSNTFFEWDSLPKSLAIVGAGYIGVEFACLLQRLGVQVTLITRRDLVLPKFDHDLRQGLHDAMNASGIKIITGRKPNIKGLGLEALGVALDAQGGVKVDAYSKTNLDWLYAVGDVTNRVQLTPVAIREGHAFSDTVFGKRPTAVDLGPVPTAVFSTPEIGTCGLTEEEARKAHDVVLYRTSFRPMKATLSGRAEKVMMKILVDKPSDKVLGVHILGEGAGEMIQLVGIAMRMGATKRDFDSTLAVHPTAAEELVTMRTPVG